MEKKQSYYIGAAILTAFVIFLLFLSVRIIPAGYKGVQLTWGAVEDTVLSEGLHFIVPFKNSVKNINVQIQKEEVVASAASSDLQSVNVQLAVNYRPISSEVNSLYREVGIDYGERIVDPAIQEMVKAATASYTAEELIGKRAEVKEDIKENLKKRLGDYAIILEDISITNFSFSKEFNKSIESKQTAEQNALKAENDLRRIEVEAKQQITRAEAEAETIRIQASAIKEQGGSEYVTLKSIQKWDGKLPQTMLSNDAVPFINTK